MIPKYLYKFRPFNHLTIMSLANNYHWLSKPTDFNDPFDCQIKIQLDELSVYDYMSHYVLAKHGKNIEKGKANVYEVPIQNLKDPDNFLPTFSEDMAKFAKHIESTIKTQNSILSLSEKFDNTTMWSHYADNHTGICIEYKPSLFNDKQNVSKEFRKVNYLPADEISFNAYELHAKCSSNENHEQYIEQIEKITTTKSDDWDYEKEWRMFHKDNGIFRYDPRALTAIYFGLRCGIEEKMAIRNLFATKTMCFFQMVRSKSGMGVEPVGMNKSSKYWDESPE